MEQTKSPKSNNAGRLDSGQRRNVYSIAHLQRTIGNQAVQRLLRSGTRGSPPSGTSAAKEIEAKVSGLGI